MKSTEAEPAERHKFGIEFYNRYGESVREETTAAPDIWSAIRTAERRGKHINARLSTPWEDRDKDVAVYFDITDKRNGLIIITGPIR